jgi:hypothetical protein
MAEVADPRADHRHIPLVGGVMTSSSRRLPPGWMAQVAPASAAAMRPSANGKNASLPTADRRARVLRRLLSRWQSESIDTAHLAGTDSESPVARGVNDRIRFHVFDHSPGQSASRPVRLPSVCAR